MASQDDIKTDFRLADGQGYILDQGHLATARLSLQYFLWQRSLKFVIHPSINLPHGAKAAEVAAGNLLWAIDAVGERPDLHVEASDINLTQGPAKGWLPDNIKLTRWNLFEDPPQEALGTFDLVHVRLLVLVLSGHDPLVVIRRFMALLKPGGWLQWEDLDPMRSCVVRARPDVSSPGLDAIVAMSDSGGRHNWVSQLAELMSQAGLLDIQRDKFDDPAPLVRAFNDQHLMTMTEFATGLVRAGKAEAAKNVLEMIKKGYGESVDGAAICYPRICCVGRKPLEP